jgi:ATP-dependent Clp protease adaptor protein ClpS
MNPFLRDYYRLGHIFFAMSMIKELELTKLSTQSDVEKTLMLYNDDYNTFSWVVRSLVDVCRHSEVQADQCAHIAHFKGKCAVASGSKDDLLPKKTSLQDRGLTVALV